ncbi:MAG: sugar ABC transporter substrate-binding protein [Anaerolineaceae bacterium]|nr:sugar ABC transporter substrate-binding protein [Anaerolineaceae bacterium]
MKMNKILFAFLVVFAIIIAGCSQPPEQTPVATISPQPEAVSTQPAANKEPVTLEWWVVPDGNHSEATLRGLAAEFEKTHANIKINVLPNPESGYNDKMSTALGAGSGAPDVAIFWDNNWLTQTLPLDEFIKRDEIDSSIYFEGAWNNFAEYNGKILGLPLGYSSNFLMYNKDVFDAKKVEYPTWDITASQYVDLISKLADPESKTFGGDTPRGPYRAIYQNFGAFPYSDDSKKVEGYLNSDASVKAYEWLWDVVNTKAAPTPTDLKTLSQQGTGPVDLFYAGKLAMVTTSPAYMLKAHEQGIKFGIVPEPGVEGNHRYAHAFSLTASIWKGTKHPEEAWEFLKFYAGPEGQKYLMENGNFLPSVKSLYQDHPLFKEEFLQTFYKILELPSSYTWANDHLCFRGAVINAISDAWDRILINDISREEIKPLIDSLVPSAQAALDECVPRLGN